MVPLSSRSRTAYAGNELALAFERSRFLGERITSACCALSAYALRYLARDLRRLIARPADLHACAAASYLHGNGFYKLVLDQAPTHKLRLHVWLPGVNAEENIHEHRWAFASVVLCGALHSELYAEDVGPESRGYDEYLYLAREGVSAPSRTLVGTTRLACVKRIVRHAGDAYTMTPGSLHRIVRTNGALTATLMCQSGPARRGNRLITLPGQEPDVDQRFLDAGQAARVIQALLEQLTAPQGASHLTFSQGVQP